MAIKEIKITNFKSFKNLEVKLGNFHVLIGANASGKSNFIQIFKFLRDIVNLGLDNAISMQGGVGYLRNIKIGAAENFSMEVTSSEEYRFGMRKKDKSLIVSSKNNFDIFSKNIFVVARRALPLRSFPIYSSQD